MVSSHERNLQRMNRVLSYHLDPLSHILATGCESRRFQSLPSHCGVIFEHYSSAISLRMRRSVGVSSARPGPPASARSAPDAGSHRDKAATNPPDRRADSRCSGGRHERNPTHADRDWRQRHPGSGPDYRWRCNPPAAQARRAELVAIQAATMLHACKRHPAGVNVSTMSEFFHSLALHLTRRLACGCRTGARQSCGGHGCWLDHE